MPWELSGAEVASSLTSDETHETPTSSERNVSAQTEVIKLGLDIHEKIGGVNGVRASIPVFLSRFFNIRIPWIVPCGKVSSAWRRCWGEPCSGAATTTDCRLRFLILPSGGRKGSGGGTGQDSFLAGGGRSPLFNSVPTQGLR